MASPFESREGSSSIRRPPERPRRSSWHPMRSPCSWRGLFCPS
ncbi:MAG: hypothetical protein DMD99_00755 [Candidatus Rokuibacteriota bacterium]|nr:MAG: hypothetical protein DMD99_00755 [Candidatus Rokubacteria bacterium]